ncbi:MAG: type III pantothenate kinase [Gammaproteobacteria bacterium]
MTWLVDMGNTRIRWCREERAGLSSVQSAVYVNRAVGEVLNGLWVPRGAVHVVSVAPEVTNHALADWIHAQGGGPVVFHATPARGNGLVNSYPEAATMGVDRWAAMVGGRTLMEGAYCVIDCGSALTVDVVDAAGLHQGGGIVPGFRLMSGALTGETARILVGDSGMGGGALGTDTAACVSAGVEAAVIGGALELIRRGEEQLDCELPRLLCGGDAERIRLAVQPCRYVPDLVLRGLAAMARDVPLPQTRC